MTVSYYLLTREYINMNSKGQIVISLTIILPLVLTILCYGSFQLYLSKNNQTLSYNCQTQLLKIQHYSIQQLKVIIKLKEQIENSIRKLNLKKTKFLAITNPAMATAYLSKIALDEVKLAQKILEQNALKINLERYRNKKFQRTIYLLKSQNNNIVNGKIENNFLILHKHGKWLYWQEGLNIDTLSALKINLKYKNNFISNYIEKNEKVSLSCASKIIKDKNVWKAKIR